jgi:hypothetical protein
MGTLEKETISAGLMSLPDDVSGTVLEMIKADQPAVDVSLLFQVVPPLANIYRSVMMAPSSLILISLALLLCGEFMA